MAALEQGAGQRRPYTKQERVGSQGAGQRIG